MIMRKYRRRRAGRTQVVREWTLKEMRLLGTATDRDIARVLNRNVGGVSAKRHLLRVPAFKPNARDWTSAELQLLGKMPDDELAKKIGRSRNAVKGRRIQLGLPKAGGRITQWRPEEDALLKRLGNREAARRTGRSVHSIESRRARLGIAFRRKPWSRGDSAKPSGRAGLFWSKEEDALLGKMTDRQLARKLGRTVEAVRARRHSMRISLRRKWHPEEEKVLGSRSDSKVAKLLGRDVSSVSNRRRQLGIPAFEQRESDLVTRKLASMSDEQIARLLRRPGRLRSRPRVHRGKVRAPNWTAAEDRLLGKWPDKDVARFLERTVRAVEGRRQKLRILRSPHGRPWTAREKRLIDPSKVEGPPREWIAQLAKTLGRSVIAIKHRRRLTYGRLRPQPARWTRRELRLLGTRPDKEVAALIGRRCGTVQVVRNSRGIKSYRARHKFRWTPARERLLGKLTDKALARRFHTHRKAIEARRHALGVAAFGKLSWTAEQERLVGTMPDAEVARQIGRTKKAVAHRRVAMGLAPFAPDA